MNTILHPGHWFHHQHLQKADEHPGMRWSELFHSEVFWIFVVLAAVLVPLIVLAVLYGETEEWINTPPMVYQPKW